VRQRHPRGDGTLEQQPGAGRDPGGVTGQGVEQVGAALPAQPRPLRPGDGGEEALAQAVGEAELQVGQEEVAAAGEQRPAGHHRDEQGEHQRELGPEPDHLEPGGEPRRRPRAQDAGQLQQRHEQQQAGPFEHGHQGEQRQREREPPAPVAGQAADVGARRGPPARAVRPEGGHRAAAGSPRRSWR
jgi:hypothetical protein